MNISYDYYRIFYYVAKYGSFTAAANVLLNNQPNITRAMKTLESQLGCTLFVRTNKGITLTSEGEALYSHISLAVEHIQSGEEEIAANKGLQKGIVSIGATEISLRCFLLPILNEYRKKYPGIHMRISNLSTPQAMSALKRGLVDFAVVTTPTESSSELRETKVKTFGEIAVCGEALQEKLKGKRFLLKDLVEYPIVSLEKGYSSYTFYTELFAKRGASYSPDIEVATADQILPIVKHNLGIGFVPEHFLLDEPSGIYKLELSEPIPQREICVVTRREHTLSLAAKELSKMMVKK
ncbi:MAG: LysR family transcriptional regulator [Clostridia bacterium]|nr:LysR family transcriptional regulator [Clostridia bacterium]